MVDKAIFNWFLSMQSQNVSLSAAMVQKQALTFTKELKFETFQGIDGWLRCWMELKSGN